VILPLQLLLIPIAITVAYATSWCLPHLWEDIRLMYAIGMYGFKPSERPRPNTWWLRKHFSNYRTLQWRHALRHPFDPYPDLTT
jgi:hypothetical protein